MGKEVLFFLHGCCHYFALALAEKYGYPIVLWLDNDFEDLDGTTCLVHAFNMVETDSGPIFVDVRGTTHDINDIIEVFGLNEEPDLVGLTADEARGVLSCIGASFSDECVLRMAKRYIRENDGRFRVVLAETREAEAV